MSSKPIRRQSAAAAATKKPYVIRTSSLKGGVGKTTVAVNLSTALSTMGYKVLLIDSDLANPSVKYFLGLEKQKIGYTDVLLGKAKLENAVVTYKPTGLKIIPGAETDNIPFPVVYNVDKVARQLYKSDFQFVILDTSPGIMSEKLTHFYNEVLLVATPEMPALASVMKLSKIYNENGIKNNLLVNRFSRNVDINDVAEAYGKRPLGVLPEDPIVSVSLAKQIPAYLLDKKAPFTSELQNVSMAYAKVATNGSGKMNGSKK
jgi:septum site-determining protein MinD